MGDKEQCLCVMDFGGSYNSEKYGRIYPFNCWAFWFPEKGMTYFGGAYCDIPDMPSTQEPTEDEVDQWVNKHWNEDEWYPKYLKALADFEDSEVCDE